jgi:hypothetical protein
MLPTRQGTNGLTGLLQGVEQCETFIRDLAAVILPPHPSFESVWDVTNRVYDRSYSGMSLVPRHCRPNGKQIALSA